MSYTWSDVRQIVDYIIIKFREIPVIGHNEGTEHGADQCISTEEIAGTDR